VKSCQEGEGDEVGPGLADSCGLQVYGPACSLFLDLRTAGLGFLLHALSSFWFMNIRGGKWYMKFLCSKSMVHEI
jgi:hypothetical protein